MIWLDFETRSRCDLKSRGVYNYAQDMSYRRAVHVLRVR
jgi:hypothetical protein